MGPRPRAVRSLHLELMGSDTCRLLPPRGAICHSVYPLQQAPCFCCAVGTPHATTPPPAPRIYFYPSPWMGKSRALLLPVTWAFFFPKWSSASCHVLLIRKPQSTMERAQLQSQDLFEFYLLIAL